ncbi:MAG TPA: guanylate kinase [Thermodesulfovibrionales bacterium]|nr:guanylate kinase [Thermodesulfovibrionales bacterium]
MIRKKSGNLFVVSAPSGAGKTTLCRQLISELPDIGHSVSYTTRFPRPREVSDRDYTFVDEGEFRKMIEDNEFVEWAKVHGNLYGTSRKRLYEMMGKGLDVLLDIDTQGARHFRASYENGVYIFILPPSLDVLRARLEGRMSDSPEEIALRMKRSVQEIGEYKNYDYVIVNDVFDEALTELKAVVIAERIKTERVDPEWIRNVMA